MAANQKYLTSSDLKTINGNSIIGDGNLGIDSLVETTWSALKQLRDSSGLTPGVQYRITDYNTTTAQGNTQAAGHQFDVIVVADDNHTLNENARAALHSGDTYFSTAGAKLDAWELKYSIDNDTNRFAWADSGSTGRGVIYRMIDEWGNDCPYDFKNIQFARWEQTNPVGYKYDEAQGDYVEDSDQFWVSNYNLKEGFYSIDGSSNDVMLFYDEREIGDFTKKISYTVSSTPTYCYTFGVGLDASLGKNIFNNIIKERCGGQNQLTLNNIVFLQTALTQNCYSNTFWNNCYSNTLGNDCYENTFGYGCNSNTFGNYCYSNTFGNYCNSNTFGNICYSNTLGSNCGSNTFRHECNYNTFGNGCICSTFGYRCCSNILGDDVLGITFDNGCCSNTFGDECRSITFGYSCNSNTFGEGCDSNTFGYGCHSNTFLGECRHNTFGNNCYSSTLGNNCNSNTFGNYCYSNTFGNYCSYNTFGNYCYYITFGLNICYFIAGSETGATTSAQTKDFIQYIIVENGVQNVNVYCTGTTGFGNCCQNIKINLGVKGASSSNRLQIDVTSQIGATDCVTYQTANSHVINI